MSIEQTEVQPRMIKHQDAVDKFAVKFTRTPILIMKQELFNKLMHFVNQGAPNECMWYSCIDRYSKLDDASEMLMYTITDLFIPAQKVGPKDVETASPSSMMEMWQEIRTERTLDTAALSALMKRGRFWGHSHVDMPPRPSGDDDKQWGEIKESCLRDTTLNPVGMIILNRKQEYTARIYDPVLKLEFENVALFKQDFSDYRYVDSAIKAKITKLPPPAAPQPISTAGNNYSGYQTPAAANATSGAKTPEKKTTQNQQTTGGGPTTTQGLIAQYSKAKQVSTAKSTGGAPTDGVSLKDGDSLFVRRYLPVSLLAKDSINKAIVALEKITEAFLPDTLSARISKKVESINRLTINQGDEIGKGVDDLIQLLDTRPGLSESSVADLGIAICLLETIKHNIVLPSDQIFVKVQTELEELVCTREQIKSYFDGQVIDCEQMLPFAVGVAVLYRTLADTKPDYFYTYVEHMIIVTEAIQIAIDNSQKKPVTVIP